MPTAHADATHASTLASWVESANAPDTDFPIQNLPFGRFRREPGEPLRIGVAIGDSVVDLQDARLIDHGDMSRLMAAGASQWRALRSRLSEALRRDSSSAPSLRNALHRTKDVQLELPCDIGGYTDFYAGIHHARTVGKLFRPDQPLLPNYKWVPIGYHGRASSIVVSGRDFHRPCGQLKAPDADEPRFGPSLRLDYELELGLIVGKSNALGESVPIENAEAHLFGITLLNDWSARDIQAWEYQPLGPFLAKNFATTLSPWIVTLDALQPFRAPFVRAADDPPPLPYLDSASNRAHGAFDIQLEVWLETARMREQHAPPVRLSRSNFRDAYWTAAQLIAHHTSNGCNLGAGDVLGSGTMSGPDADQGGSLLELTQGRAPLDLRNGETRTFLEDGDAVILRAFCERAGCRRIGFGECRATVLPARPVAITEATR
jgi:fumarylacetoacetase